MQAICKAWAPMWAFVWLLTACGGASDSATPAPSQNISNALLISLQTEMAGSNCADGGIQINAGLDINSNNILDPSEITRTRYECNDAINRGFTWQNISASSVQAQPNTGYLASSANEVAINLPRQPRLGDTVRASGVGTGGWRFVQGAGQSIIFTDVPVLAPPVPSWVGRLGSTEQWARLASSASGRKLVAAPGGYGATYTSDDYGLTWMQGNLNESWTGLAMSADGMTILGTTRGGQIYVSTNFGASWIARASSQQWYAVASSADGRYGVAVVAGGQIWTSVGNGLLGWISVDSNRNWVAVASSASGSQVIAAAQGDGLYTSNDYGTTWIKRATDASWHSVASSADGKYLAATAYNSQIYVSSDFGVNWSPKAISREWRGITMSADGQKLVAVNTQSIATVSNDFGETWTEHAAPVRMTHVVSSADGNRLMGAVNGGMVHIANRNQSTVGAAGGISGLQNQSVELQYIGDGVFTVLSYGPASIGFSVR